MEHLAKLFLALIELAESELESLKNAVLRLGLSLVFLVVAAVTGTIGIVLLLAAGFLLLKLLLGTIAALAISGLLFLAITGVLAVVAMRKSASAKAATIDAAHPSSPAVPQHEPVPPIRIAS